MATEDTQCVGIDGPSRRVDAEGGTLAEVEGGTGGASHRESEGDEGDEGGPEVEGGTDEASCRESEGGEGGESEGEDGHVEEVVDCPPPRRREKVAPPRHASRKRAHSVHKAPRRDATPARRDVRQHRQDDTVTSPKTAAPSVRSFLQGKFVNLAALLRDAGANEETLDTLLGLHFDHVCKEMVRRSLPHRGTDYMAAADEFLYELAVPRPSAALRKKVARYLTCFAEVLGVDA